MEEKQSRQPVLSRLAVSVIMAAGLYAAWSRWGERLPLPDWCAAWLRENKVQAVALLAAAIFGLSLAVLPPPRGERPAPPPEDADPCQGYERAG